ncbi:MAG: hypothetical protein L3V56_10410 [Candidatus Magnetoovum sp. WYHC-5]|nr:hypothetical protein [Candidatus Magnetoovum sp. WYHC-5]
MNGIGKFNPLDYVMKGPDVSELIEKQIKADYKKYHMNNDESFKVKNFEPGYAEVADKTTADSTNSDTNNIDTHYAQINDVDSVAKTIENANKHGLRGKVYSESGHTYNSTIEINNKAKDDRLFGGVQHIKKTMEEHGLYMAKTGIQFRIYV